MWGVVVHRGPAGVHFHLAGGVGDKFLHLVGERVIQFHNPLPFPGGPRRFFPNSQRAPPGPLGVSPSVPALPAGGTAPWRPGPPRGSGPWCRWGGPSARRCAPPGRARPRQWRPGGTASSTTAPAATRALSPTVKGPSTLAPAPTSTLFPRVGWRLPWSLPVPPRVTPWYRVQLSPIWVVSPMTTPMPWSINSPRPIWAPGVDLDAGLLPAALGDPPGQKLQVVLEAPVGLPVGAHRLKPGVEEKHLPPGSGRRGPAPSLRPGLPSRCETMAASPFPADKKRLRRRTASAEATLVRGSTSLWALSEGNGSRRAGIFPPACSGAHFPLPPLRAGACSRRPLLSGVRVGRVLLSFTASACIICDFPRFVNHFPKKGRAPGGSPFSNGLFRFRKSAGRPPPGRGPSGGAPKGRRSSRGGRSWRRRTCRGSKRR